MPSRIIREGINTSSKILALSPLAELFYRRLMTVADDYGRFYAHPATIRTACWPTAPDRATDKQVAAWLDECCQGDDPLIVIYEASGAQYLEISNFNQQKRFKSKFPGRLAVTKQPLSESEAGANPPLSDRLATASTPVVSRISLVDSRKSKPKGLTRFALDSPAEDYEQYPKQKFGWDQMRVIRQFEKFRNYWQAKGELRADWLATWRNWCISDEERNPTRSVEPYRPSLPQNRSIFEDQL